MYLYVIIFKIIRERDRGIELEILSLNYICFLGDRDNNRDKIR